MAKPEAGQHDQIVAKMRKEEQLRQTGYREQALKLFPHVCSRCVREFEGKKLRELTVHHRDHNHATVSKNRFMASFSIRGKNSG